MILNHGLRGLITSCNVHEFYKLVQQNVLILLSW
jgi:hypothetical protein